MQDAVRLLMLIQSAMKPLQTPPPDDPELRSAVGVVRTQTRLQKLDFWVRNPDYLANELLNDYEAGDRDPALLTLASEILESEEPELRTYPMLRYLFGAYEPLDDGLAVLRSADLVVRRLRGTLSHTSQHDYYLLRAGRELAEEIVRDYPALSWYATRSALVVALASGKGATTLKDRQYLQDEYVNTPNGQRIPMIIKRVRGRVERLLADREVETA